MKYETDKTINISLSDVEKSPDISKLKSIYKLLGKATQGVPDSVAAVLARAENVENIDIRLPYESVSVASLRNTYKKLSENNC